MKRTKTPDAIAKRWMRNLDGARALRELEAHLALHPRDADGWLLKGRLLLAESRPRRAVAALRQALRILPTFHMARIELAEAYAEMGNLERARAVLAQGLEAIGMQLDGHLFSLCAFRLRARRKAVRFIGDIASRGKSRLSAEAVARELIPDDYDG